MSARPAIVGVVAAAGLGAGLWVGYLLFGQGAPPAIGGAGGGPFDGPASGVAPLAGGAGGGPAGGLAPLPGTAGGGAPDPAGGGPATRPSVPGWSAGGRTARRVPAAAEFRGQGTISGLVRSRQGQPLAGVVVRAAPFSRWGAREPWRPLPDDPSLREKLAEAETDWRTANAGRVEVTTGTDGRFRFEQLADRLWTVRAFHPKFKFDAPAGSSRRPNAVVELIGNALCAVEVSIIGPDGAEPPETDLRFRRDGQRGWGDRLKWSPEQPTLYLEPGTYSLWAISPRRPEQPADAPRWESEQRDLVVAPGQETQSVTLELRKQPTLSGTVAPPSGSSLDGVRVFAVQGADGFAEGANAPGRLSAWMEGNFYTFYDIEPGTWTVGVINARGGPIVFRTVVEVTEGTTVLDLELPPRDPATHLRVVVMDHEGGQRTDARFTLIYPDRKRKGRTKSDSLRGALQDGVWWLALDGERQGIVRKQSAGGPVHLEVSVGVLGNQRVELTPSLSEPIEVRMGRSGTLRLTLSGAGEREYWVRLEPVDAESGGLVAGSRRTVHGKRTDDAWRFGPAQPGEYELRVSVKPGPRMSTVPLMKQRLSVAAGEHSQTVALPALHRLTVQVPDGSQGSAVRVTAVDPLWGGIDQVRATGQLDANGRVTFELPAGSYKLNRWSRPHRGEMAIRVPGAGAVTFAGESHNAHRVSLSGKGAAAWRKIGLRDGDIVIGLNGREFQNTKEIWSWAREAGDGQVTLRVQRRGEILDLHAGAKEVVRAGRTGLKLSGTVRPR